MKKTATGYAKRERVMILKSGAYYELDAYLRDLGVAREYYDLKKEDGIERIYWIRFRASLPLFERARKLAQSMDGLIASSGYGY